MTKLPKYIDVELNTSCNLSCEVCPYKEVHKQPKLMNWELYEKIIKQIDWNPSIKLCQRGEPLLSPILIEAIKLAHRHGFHTIFNTNGYFLKTFTIPLLESGLDALILSDYGEDIQIENGHYFSIMNDAFGFPVKIIVKTNRHDKWSIYADKIMELVYHPYEDKENEDNTVLPNWKCEQLFERLIIEPEGDVRCCCGSEHIDKYVGKIFFNSLKDIWNSKKLEQYRKLHLEGRSHELEMCRKCGYRKTVIKEREK